MFCELRDEIEVAEAQLKALAGLHDDRPDTVAKYDQDGESGGRRKRPAEEEWPAPEITVDQAADQQDVASGSDTRPVGGKPGSTWRKSQDTVVVDVPVESCGSEEDSSEESG